MCVLGVGLVCAMEADHRNIRRPGAAPIAHVCTDRTADCHRTRRWRDPIVGFKTMWINGKPEKRMCHELGGS